MFARAVPTPEQRQAEKDARRAALCTPSRAVARGTYAGSTGAAAPKSEPYRDATLLEMARGRACLLCAPGMCDCAHGSTVACHSNLSIHGKGGARKADDCYSVWGGDKAHERLDRGQSCRELKEFRFMAAHARQVLAWRLIAMDPTEPDRFRAAARRALERLGATQLTEMP